MNELDLLNPATFYEQVLADAYARKAAELFDQLAKASGVDAALNKATVERYDKAQALATAESGKLKKLKSIARFVLVMLIIALIGSQILIFFPFFRAEEDNTTGQMALFHGLGFFLVLIFIALLVVRLVPLKKSLKGQEAKLKKDQGIAAAERSKAVAQMIPLNSLFDWNVPSTIIRQVTPLLALDPYFDITKYAYLHDQYGFNEVRDVDQSIVTTLSGQIVGNPFLLYKIFYKEMHNRRYEGTLVITWTTMERDSKGVLHPVTHSETLRAYVTAPEPGYHYRTQLVYANDAAPSLSFTRSPSGADKLSAKQLEKKIKKGVKGIQKQVKKAVTDDDPRTQFTAMGNEKFDVLFGALDRNNEVEFRLLYTPLAQRSTLDLLLKGRPYGDDFFMQKSGRLNYIISQHSQRFDYSTSPGHYVSHSLELSRSQFINYNVNFIQGLYYDLAPLLCIPLYQQHKPREYIYNDQRYPNFTGYESEVLANALPGNSFLPPRATTSQILKATVHQKVGDADVVSVTSRAFEGVQRLTYVSVHGGDGNYHNVPVHWIEYLPLEKTSNIMVRKCEHDLCGYKALIRDNAECKSVLDRFGGSSVYQRGLYAAFLKGGYGPAEEEALAAFFARDNSGQKKSNT